MQLPNLTGMKGLFLLVSPYFTRFSDMAVTVIIARVRICPGVMVERLGGGEGLRSKLRVWIEERYLGRQGWGLAIPARFENFSEKISYSRSVAM